MVKKKNHRLLKLTVLSLLGYRGGKYVLSHPDFLTSIKQSFTETIESIHHFGQAVTKLKDSTQKLQQAVADSQPTLNAIQKDVDHFQYKLQPRLERIEKLTQDINKQLDSIGSDKPTK